MERGAEGGPGVRAKGQWLRLCKNICVCVHYTTVLSTITGGTLVIKKPCLVPTMSGQTKTHSVWD